VTSLATLSGRPVQLPAGKVALTAKAGFAYSALRGSNNQGTAGSNLKRGDTSFGANLGIPITSTREHVLEALGDMTANLSAGADYLSDFGWLVNWSGGLTWNLTRSWGFRAAMSITRRALAFQPRRGAGDDLQRHHL
jgi:hypothetical protein